MNTEELVKLRIDDIEFFARRYSELFGEHFDKNTSEEKEEFYKEIKEELFKKAPRYVIVNNDPMHDAQGESYSDRIELSGSSGAIENRAIRIHELFHSYNHMEKGKQGLRDFDNELVLKNLDEGSTEMFAQIMCGNEGKDTVYSSEVKLTRFLTNIVGERTMIRATRGNPQLLCETTDRLLGTQDFLQKLEKMQYEKNKLISQSFGENSFFGNSISKYIQMLSKLKLETFRGKDEISMLIDAVEQSGNQKLYNNIVQTDDKFGYDVFFRRGLGVDDNNFDSQQPTLASVQQDILKVEMDELDEVEDISLQTVLEMEIKKFLYDRISYQQYFLEHPEPKYGTYELTSEDREFSENFRSNLDGAEERLGGRIGLVGPGNRIDSLENTPHLVNEKMVKKMNLPEVGFDELQDFRLEIWAEKLNIAQTREFLNEWTEWTYNAWYKEIFPDGKEETFKDAIEEIKRKLDEKEQGLVDKYKALENEKQQSGTKEESLLDSTANEEKISEIGQVELEKNEFSENNVETENETSMGEIQCEEKINKEILKEQTEDKSIDLWMNRFGGWYGAIDRVSRSVRANFIKMKSDIVKAISGKIKERSNKREINKDQNQNGR